MPGACVGLVWDVSRPTLQPLKVSAVDNWTCLSDGNYQMTSAEKTFHGHAPSFSGQPIGDKYIFDMFETITFQNL
jgi:hypothetical protein